VRENEAVTRIVIVGGGPGGYEAALVAAQLGAEVTVVERDGVGGSAVLTDCVPSKTLIATAEVMTQAATSSDLGVIMGDGSPPDGVVGVDLGRVNGRVLALARNQSADIARGLERRGVRVVRGLGRLDGPHRVLVEPVMGVGGSGGAGVETNSAETNSAETLEAEFVLLATGAHPRVLPDASPDGERILSWEQLYDLGELPERLIVVGSGVTGAEFASAYQALGSQVTLVSSRDRVLPGEDADAAGVIEDVFQRRGMTVMGRSRAESVKRTPAGVVITLADGTTVEGSHCLMAVGSVPNTAALGLETAGVEVDSRGFVTVDKVSRTSAQGVYAAGDCTGVLMLASVAAMQGRIAVWHALGEAVAPLNLRAVASNIFTTPEIATVGYSQAEIEAGSIPARSVKLPLATNPRAKMQGVIDGFVKVFCRPDTGIVVGGVVVAPRASELIYPVALAVDLQLSVEALAHAFTVYPSVSGSISEAARQLHTRRS
jgi:NAD(P)H dehydrogenase (quinone)